MRIRSISSRNFKETRTMHSVSNNIETLMRNEADGVIDKLFESLLERYQKAKEESRKRGSKFIHENVDLLYYNLHKTSLRRSKLYIKSPEWLENKRATINLKNKKDDKCFQYVLTLALNHQNIERNYRRISKIKPFIGQGNWKDIDFPSDKKDWKKFEQNDKKIALNVLFVPHNTKQIIVAHKSKYNHKRDNQVILLIITDIKRSDGVEKWHYLAVKSFSALLRGITSNQNGDFYCLNCFHSYSTETRLKKHERLCNDHDYCCVEMPNEDNKILKYNHGQSH